MTLQRKFSNPRSIRLLVVMISSITLPRLAAAQDANEHFFPLMKQLVTDRQQLPSPYGVSIVGNWLDSTWEITSATAGLDGANIPVDFASNSDANIRSRTLGVRADVWVLPFFNVFVVGGQATADNQLILRGVPLMFIGPGIGQPAQVVRGDVVTEFTLDGPFFTLGGVLSGGYKHFFGSVDFSATQTDFGHGNKITTEQDLNYSVAPRVGYVIGLTQVWLGGRYLDLNNRITGAKQISSGQNFSFDVHLKTVSWNLTMGMRTVFGKNWEVLLESGIGDRMMVTGSIGYRW